MSTVYKVTDIGHAGDGICKTNDGKTIFAPFSLPGEEVELGTLKQGKQNVTVLNKVIQISSDRQEAPCPYFTQCGGCVAQHMKPDFYKNWKIDSIKQALERHHIPTSVLDEAIFIEENTRRRANLSAIKFKGKVTLGFKKRKSHQLIDIQKCLLLRPELNNLIIRLRILLTELLDEKGKAGIWLSVTDKMVEAHLDLGEREPFTYNEREGLADFAKSNNIAKLTAHLNGFDDPISIQSAPTVTFNSVKVLTKTKGFLQASDEADKALITHMLNYLKDVKIKNIADLFCGRGTFTFAFDNAIKVDGYEADKPAIEALNNAAKTQKNSVQGIYKNLYNDALKKEELNNYSAIVLDPPRDGAKAQCEEMAKCDVKNIVYISCNPKTFARDAEILIQGGYKLQSVKPVDQFIWSNHIEVISHFTKA